MSKHDNLKDESSNGKADTKKAKIFRWSAIFFNKIADIAIGHLAVKGKYLGILYETWESQSQICLLPLDRSCVDPSLAEPSCSLPPIDNKFLNISFQGRLKKI